MNADLARVIAAQVCIHACMAGLKLVAPLLALRDGYSATWVGVLMSLFAVSAMVLALPAGRWSDRTGMHIPVGYSVLAAVLGTATAVAWPTFATLCIAACMSGGAAGVATIALQRHVGRAVHDGAQLRRVFSWLALGPAISNFIGPFFAGLIIDFAGTTAGSDRGYRAALLFLMLLPLLTWWLVRKTPELPLPVAPTTRRSQSAWDLVRLRDFRYLLLINWLISSSWDAHAFAVALLGHERGIPAAAIGTVFGAFAIAVTAVRVVLPMVAEYVREWAVVAGVMLLIAAVFAVYPYTAGVWTMAACSVVVGIALGAGQPMIMSMLHQITPAHRHGEALGLRLMAMNASSVVMPLLFGSAGALIGVTALFWGVGAMVGVGSRLAWLLRPSQPSNSRFVDSAQSEFLQSTL